MPDYRCYFLDKNGLALFPAEIFAEDLEAAMRHAFDILNEKDDRASRSALIHPTNIEIWEGDLRKFPAERPVWRGKHVNEHSAILLP
jgi:hypothetical protein